MNNVFKSTVLLFAGVAFGGLAVLFLGPKLLPSGLPSASNESKAENEPMYWVAPMDPNYQRDKPGKSPMGMDLIPVYADDAGGGDDNGPGTIRISPDVVNNLGVRTANVESRALDAAIDTVGYVQYDQDKVTHLHPRVEGWVEKLHIKAAGDPVTAGQALYELYSPQLVNAQEEYLLALQRDNSRLIKAAEDRLQALHLSATFIRQLKRSGHVSQTVTFYAKEGGVVDNLNIREGFYVKPGTTLLSIARLDEVWVEAEVFERQVNQVAEGLSVTMTLGYVPSRTWQGIVDYVYPSLNEKTRTARVRLRFANKDYLLKPNMFALVSIYSNENNPVLSVPKEAVIRFGSENRVVLALGDGRYKSVNVELGRHGSENIEVLKGLEDGDEVVTSAQFLLDSESSKSSDFKRIYHGDGDKPASVWVEATVEGYRVASRFMTVAHAPIDEWGWPEMSMAFDVAEGVTMSGLKVGLTVHIEITSPSPNEYVISEIHIPDTKSAMSDNKGDQVDHSNHEPAEQVHENHSHESHAVHD